jgi:uncharacterized protein (DUF924 family)
MSDNIKIILNFWFKEHKPKDWFKKNKKFDNEIKDRFIKLIQCALKDALSDWEQSREGSLALILLLDQFTRNVFRGQKASFSGDCKALEISLNCAEKDYLNLSQPEWCQFILLPMMHSEDLDIQNKSLPLFKKHTDDNVYNYAVKHHQIINRFGRFPHRNIILKRESTLKEIKFLEKPGSSF